MALCAAGAAHFRPRGALGRLYYAVADGLAVWSVSIAPDGSFGTDARIELQVPPGLGPTEISKIVFDDPGMLLAERAAPTGDYDLEALALPGVGRVLRYAPVPGAGCARLASRFRTNTRSASPAR